MNTTKKIAIALAILMVAAMAAPAVMGDDDIGYTATIIAGQNTELAVSNSNFAGLLTSPSLGNHIDNTFNLTNTGGMNATVKARFTTSVSGLYGLTNASENVIGGSNFSLQADDGGANVTLNDDETDVTLSYVVPNDGDAHDYDAWLNVPPAMPEGTYAGTVRLTFVNAP